MWHSLVLFVEAVEDDEFFMTAVNPPMYYDGHTIRALTFEGKVENFMHISFQ